MNTPTSEAGTGQASLWQLTAAAGPLQQRFLLDETRRVPLQALAGGTTLAVPRARLHGACVVLRTGSQLGTALALLELDGLAARVVLCTPDLSAEHLRVAVAAAAATLVVCDHPLPELADSGLDCVIASPTVTPSAGASGPRIETEWVLFTSGTVGPPKLALHGLRSLTGAIGRGGAATAGRVWSTFYDIRRYGGLQILLRALLGGGSMVLSGAYEAPGAFLARAAAAGVSFLSGTPTHWRRALLSPAAVTVPLRDVRLSGEVADQAILDKLRDAYPQARVCHAFASTEAGVAFEVDDGLAGFPAAWIGQQRGGVALRADDGTLQIRSPRTASRYLGPHATPLMAADGFVDTNDLIERVGERYHFRGRRDGVINVGGLKVHPEEVEAVVNRHPRVEMSLVKAKRSPIIGAVVVVDVVLAAGQDQNGGARVLEAEILDQCRRALAPHKVPAAVRVVPALALSAAGKLVRAVSSSSHA